jgi:hypothetical protein
MQEDLLQGLGLLSSWRFCVRPPLHSIVSLLQWSYNKYICWSPPQCWHRVPTAFVDRDARRFFPYVPDTKILSLSELPGWQEHLLFC